MVRSCRAEWIYNGCMVEVKWESDWWHAKVKKVTEHIGAGRRRRLLAIGVCARHAQTRASAPCEARLLADIAAASLASTPRAFRGVLAVADYRMDIR